MYQDELTSEHCLNLPEWMAEKGVFVKSDKCVLIYSKRDCTSYSTKIEDNEDDLTNVKDLLENQTALSFQPCNDTEGGDQVIVDFYSTDSKEKFSGKLNYR